MGFIKATTDIKLLLLYTYEILFKLNFFVYILFKIVTTRFNNKRFPFKGVVVKHIKDQQSLRKFKQIVYKRIFFLFYKTK